VSNPQLERYLDVAVTAAFDAGRLTLAHFQTGVTPEFKEDDTPVTVADRMAEELIRGRLEAAFPDHGVVGEEYGSSRPEASHRWIVDPIDGTKAFMRGVPLYGVLLGLEIEGTIEVGVAYFPGLDDMVVARSGGGTFWNGRPCRVRETPTLARAVVSCTDPGRFDLHDRGDAWRRLMAAAYHRSGWSDAFGYALVATGRIELMADPIMSPWDAGPFPVLLREAGGYFGDWSGTETIYAREGLATTRTLLPEVLALIEG
jgi:myo-inositol-1(or 4)-monophosphatase